jgi:hypothetical protein
VSLQINIPAVFIVRLKDGRELQLDEEQLACAWSFGHGAGPYGDIGEFMNFLKWLAEQFGGGA